MKSTSLTLLTLVFIVMVFATGCDTIEATPETPANLTGAWSGEMSHPFFPGTISLSASHAGTQASGTWTWNWVSVNSGAIGVTRGTFKGSISEEGVMALTFTDAATNCGYLYAGSFKDQDEVSGDYVFDAATCRTSAKGSMTLSRQ